MSQHKLIDHYGGWNPQRPDSRDRALLPMMGPREVQQVEFLLGIDGIPTLNQGQQGSCTGHGPSGLVMYDQKAQGEPIVVPSREFIYWNARDKEGTADQDSGAMVRDAVAVVAELGAPPDTDFPYDDQVFDRKPPKQAYDDAVKQEALVYEAANYPHLNQAIASGFPLVFGFTVYESFESDEVAKTGVVPIPEKGEKVLGGHCVWCFGFNSRYTASGNDKTPPRTKACRNSWGEDWGDKGNFYMPQAMFDRGDCSDFWAIRRIGAKS